MNSNKKKQRHSHDYKQQLYKQRDNRKHTYASSTTTTPAMIRPSQSTTSHNCPSSPSSAQQHHLLSTTERLKACLKDNSMTDVALVGDDSIYVPAIRCVLGSASSVLKQLLYSSRGGSGEESYYLTEPQQNKIVPIPGFTQRILQTLVEYCCSDGDLSGCSLFQDATTAASVIDMLAFTHLAISYEIPTVPQQVVDDFVIPAMKRQPPIACLVFNYMMTVECPEASINCNNTSAINSGSNSEDNQSISTLSTKHKNEAREAEKVVTAAAALGKLYSISLHIIRTQPYQTLKSINLEHDNEEDTRQGISALHAETLEKILADKEVEADELFLLEVVKSWHDFHYSLIRTEERERQEYLEQSKPLHKITNILMKKTQKQQQQQQQHAYTNVQTEKVSTDDFPLFEAHFDDNFTFADASTLGNSSIGTSDMSASWAAFPQNNTNTAPPAPEAKHNNPNLPYVCRDPTEVCRSSFMRHIDLAAIDPIPLKQIVADSDFIDQDQVMKALWEQATLAASIPRLSFSSIVRGSGADNTAATTTTNILADLTGSNQETSIPEHQYYKSHIVVQGAGVEDCNGIYAQVVAPPGNRRTSNATPISDEEANYGQDENDEDDDEANTQICIETVNTRYTQQSYIKKNIPSLLSPTASVSSRTILAGDETVMTTVAEGGEDQHNNSATTGICLRFVKRGANNSSRKNKSKTWYLVCRREPTPIINRNDNAITSSFLHCWTLIEEDSRSEDQLRVLYEWEMEGEIIDAASMIRNKTTIASSGESSVHDESANDTAAFVVDGTNLQAFPERGWSSVRSKFAPAPTMTWCRPRYGAPVLVVPPPAMTTRNRNSKTRKSLPSAQQRRRRRTNGDGKTRKATVTWRDDTSRYSRQNDEVLLDSLAGVTMPPAWSDDDGAASVHTGYDNNENSAPLPFSPPASSPTATPAPIRKVTVPKISPANDGTLMSARHKGSLMKKDSFASATPKADTIATAEFDGPYEI